MKLDNLEQLITSEPQFVDSVEEPVDRAEVLRYLGYPVGYAPNPNIEKALAYWICEASQLAAPRASYLILPVISHNQRRLKVQSSPREEVTFQGAIGQFLAASQLLVAFIATAGPEVERLATRLLAESDELAAMIVNSVGAERAEAAEAAVIKRVHKLAQPFDFATTLPYSPGYCGMALAEQRKLFGLFGAATAGVSLSEACLMQPIKSISGLVGLGPRTDIQIAGSPCDRCELHGCNMRR